MPKFGLLIVFVLFIFPAVVFAENTEADQQCPPGGTVGQPCKDTTNGYVTSGHCTHINICKADSWNKNPPKGCGSSGNIYAPTADCPKGPVIPNGTKPPPSVGMTPTSTPSSGATISSDLFGQAFSTTTGNFYMPSNTVSTTSENGIEFFISGNEKLPGGTALTPEPPPPPPRSALGSPVGLAPGGNPKAAEGYAPTYGGFAPSPVSFALPPGQSASQGSDFRQFVQNAVNALTVHLVDSLMRLTGAGNVELVPAGISALAVITPAQSLYEQANGADLSPYVVPNWNARVATTFPGIEATPRQRFQDAFSALKADIYAFVQKLFLSFGL
ncbi:hypothetical protein HY968_03640 [Candidatus Kaiserbacteria bacterium]|nr:hypothetical protein [Candidatus Kaiserbacteria bacterium]